MSGRPQRCRTPPIVWAVEQPRKGLFVQILCAIMRAFFVASPSAAPLTALLIAMNTTSFIVAALYKFVELPDFEALAEPLKAECLRLGLKGTLLLAAEGINGTVSGPPEGIAGLLSYLQRDQRFAGIEHKESVYDEQPFYRMKVKLKKEIVTMGVDGIDPKQIV